MTVLLLDWMIDHDVKLMLLMTMVIMMMMMMMMMMTAAPRLDNSLV